MASRFWSTSVLAICGLALCACVPQKPKTATGPTYQAPVSAIVPPTNVRAICYDDAQLSAYRVRMVQQELAVGVLTCKDADGSRKYDRQYVDFLAKFNPELSSNAAELHTVVASKHVNFDVLITEIANRTAQRPAEDPAFCSRNQRALEWSLVPTVTTLTEVPSPYDLGPDMNIFPCPHG